MRILVAGLGLIGGSMAKAISQKTPHTVLGYDKSPEVLEAALESGAIHQVASDFSDGDLILLALYPGDCLALLEKNKAVLKPGTTIIDLCGVKQVVCEGAEKILKGTGAVFIGGHPMAGRECSGFSNASADLFCGADMILTPQDSIDPATLEWVKEFFLSIGFQRTPITTPEHHDGVIAYTSQLAHVVSSAYVKSPTAEEFFGFSAGSFRDLTRVAKLNPTMWTELFLENAEFLTREIEIIIQHLQDYRDVIQAKDGSRLYEMLLDGSERKTALDQKGER